jgi:hypothetical protein
MPARTYRSVRAGRVAGEYDHCQHFAAKLLLKKETGSGKNRFGTTDCNL